MVDLIEKCYSATGINFPCVLYTQRLRKIHPSRALELMPVLFSTNYTTRHYRCRNRHQHLTVIKPLASQGRP